MSMRADLCVLWAKTQVSETRLFCVVGLHVGSVDVRWQRVGACLFGGPNFENGWVTCRCGLCPCGFKCPFRFEFRVNKHRKKVLPACSGGRCG